VRREFRPKFAAISESACPIHASLLSASIEKDADIDLVQRDAEADGYRVTRSTVAMMAA
jgi:hypothetical protein